MCGRIAQTDSPEELAELLSVQMGVDDLADVTPSYNVAPSSEIIALRLSAYGDEMWTTLQWGMLPVWSRLKRPVINARMETVGRKPMFRESFSRRRCVIPATAYYEWLSSPAGNQPYCFRLENDISLLLAGLYLDGQCVILTRPAQEDTAFIHNRMPVVLDAKMIREYLSTLESAFNLIELDTDIKLQTYPVDRKVGNPRYNSPACLNPVTQTLA
jgi:putative SOS response-associated peptidase YedK